MRHLLLGILALIATPLILSSCSKSEPGDAPPSAQQKSIKKGDLTRAVILGQESQVLALIERGANVNENVGNASMQITPLISAVITDNQNISRILLIHGADEEANLLGYSPKDLAFALDRQSIYEQLQ